MGGGLRNGYLLHLVCIRHRPKGHCLQCDWEEISVPRGCTFPGDFNGHQKGYHKAIEVLIQYNLAPWRLALGLKVFYLDELQSRVVHVLRAWCRNWDVLEW